MKIVSANSIRAIVAPALVAASLFAAGSAAQAQTAAPTGVRGTVTALSGDVLKVHTRDGKDVDVKLAKDTPIRGVALANVNDIKPDSYVGTAAIPQPDGTLKALEVHVFPASMRGTGDGHRPWDLGSNSTMTNGTVGSLVVSNGRTITVKYKDGEGRAVRPQGSGRLAGGELHLGRRARCNAADVIRRCSSHSNKPRASMARLSDFSLFHRHSPCPNRKHA
jgi:hypothetical protein